MAVIHLDHKSKYENDYYINLELLNTTIQTFKTFILKI